MLTKIVLMIVGLGLVILACVFCVPAVQGHETILDSRPGTILVGGVIGLVGIKMILDGLK